VNEVARESLPPDRHLLGRWTPWIVVLVLAAVVVAVFAVSREAGRDRAPADLDPAFVYDVERYKVIPEERIGYRETARFDTGLESAKAIAAGPAGEIVVGGDERVRVFTASGVPTRALLLGYAPQCLTVSSEGELWVASHRAVERNPLHGPLTRVLEIPGKKTHITSIAVSRDALFVADMGERAVRHYTLAGDLVGRIGTKDQDRNVPGFVVPSPYFDLLVARDGLLRIVDPGRHRVTAFTVDGYLEQSWGRPSFALEGFSGCCNPSHIAQLPDGSFVTSEKGIARVKVYDAEGRFVTAVVGTEGLDTESVPCDIAVDGQGRILVLDPGRSVVRIFESTEGRSARDD
jgi:hypothetical protein